MITRETVARCLAAHIHGEMSVDALVEWAEDALMEAEFEPSDAKMLAEIVGRLGVADVRAFGLSWRDCEELLSRLGYPPRVEIANL